MKTLEERVEILKAKIASVVGLLSDVRLSRICDVMGV